MATQEKQFLLLNENKENPLYQTSFSKPSSPVENLLH